MSEKSDDIKQLFSHLGLNPSDYQEIRSAPSANATVTEAPRRWSLLQATTQHPLPTKIPPIVSSPAPASAVPPPSLIAPAAVPRALPPRTNPAGWVEPHATVSVPAPTPVTPPPAGDQPLAEGLRALFQSVREPAPVAPLPGAPTVAAPPPAEPSAEQVYRELRGSAPTPAAVPPPPAWAGYDSEQETRYAVPPTPARSAVPPPVRAPAPPPAPSLASQPQPQPQPPAARAKAARPAPAPMAPPPPSPAAAAALRTAPSDVGNDLRAAFRRLAEPEPPRAAASGRLRLRYPASPSAQVESGKEARLDDVLRRISGHNGPSK